MTPMGLPLSPCDAAKKRSARNNVAEVLSSLLAFLWVDKIKEAFANE